MPINKLIDFFIDSSYNHMCILNCNNFIAAVSDRLAKGDYNNKGLYEFINMYQSQ